jgi:hypothetical protein
MISAVDKKRYRSDIFGDAAGAKTEGTVFFRESNVRMELLMRAPFRFVDQASILVGQLHFVNRELGISLSIEYGPESTDRSP